MALSIALATASALPLQAASPDDLDRIAKSEICPADLRSYLSIPLSEACPENQLTAISPDQMNQCRDDWSRDDSKITRYNLFIERCRKKTGTAAAEPEKGGRTTVWKQVGSRPSKVVSFPPLSSTSVAKGDEDRIPSPSIQPTSAEPTCMDACMVDPKLRGTDPGSPARKALCLFTC